MLAYFGLYLQTN